MEQHPLQHHHRHRDRGPLGGKLRDLPPGRGKPSQKQ